MFTRISVPTPFQIGRVNAYVAGRTVVDPGPDSEEAWAALLDGLNDHDLAPGDIEQVLVTHPHPDHFGLASRLHGLGARVAASPTAADIIGDFRGRLEDEQKFFRPFFERCGLSAETANTVTDLPTAFLPYAPDVQTERELADGDTITIGETALSVDAVTGHASGEILFSFEADGERRALVGDNVLGSITPNPFLQPPPEPGGERPRVLPAYNESLAWLRDQRHGQFLPGHGDRIDDPPGRIDEILAAHEDRTAAVYDLVDGPTVPADVMHGLFDDLPVTEQFSGLSEAVGHLDVLVERDRITSFEDDGVVRYRQG